MDLSERMQAPSLALEPSPGLVEAVRGRARRVRRRRRAAGSALVLAAVLSGAAVLPGLLSREPEAGRLATSDQSYGVEGATSSVVLLDEVNDADVVVYFRGPSLCAESIRVTRKTDCSTGVSPASTAAFPFVWDVRSKALRVDEQQLLAGVVRGDVQQVAVELAEGPPLRATATRERGFPLPVFSVELPRGADVVGLVAYGSDGGELGRRQP